MSGISGLRLFVPFTAYSVIALKEPSLPGLNALNALLHEKKEPPVAVTEVAATEMILVFSRHRHYRHLVIELVQAARNKTGQLKNPLRVLDPINFIWKAREERELKFFAGLTQYKNSYQDQRSEKDLEALKAILQNPFSLPIYLHEEERSATVNAASLRKVSISTEAPDIEIYVDERPETMEISAIWRIKGKKHLLQDLPVRFQYFIQRGDRLWLIAHWNQLALIDFFRQNQNDLVMGRALYEQFQENVLDLLEKKTKIHYSYLKLASPAQQRELGFDLANEQWIYLTESGDFVLITPVMKYGSVEIPVLSRKQIKVRNKREQYVTLRRDEEKEIQFITAIVKAHPRLMEQVDGFERELSSDCFYLHRTHFLNPEWFLEAFENWREKGILLMGFHQLKNNRLSPYRAQLDIKVASGMDWFETALKLRFNQQTVSLKHLHRSIRQKNRFVLLDDGTLGILPLEWLQKMESYFGAAFLEGEILKTPAISFSKVQQLYEEDHLEESAKEKIRFLQTRLSGMQQIEPIPIPAALQATLRDYQKEGLYWLNFLDELHFGACLADDMGLGKTLQVIAFLLSQRSKVEKNVNLIVVPASLVFNWQQEVTKFAPDLKIHSFYGAERGKDARIFDDYEVVLTSYGTLLSDIGFLKTYRFNYLVLDESQHIKNPESQRYKAARLLQARNRLVLTGTPVENNTHDLYGQLSFACPGLLGTKDEFKRLYAIPIDQFKDSRRAAELRERIRPFILRRTKEQVMAELPEQQETVLYCEMGVYQREVYDRCREEIRAYLLKQAGHELIHSQMQVLQGITRLRQICNSPSLLEKNPANQEESAKIAVLLEQIEMKSANHKLLVFSQFVTMLDLIAPELQKKGIPYVQLTGQTKKRETVVHTFQEDPSIRVFLISLKAGGVGINLTAADYVFLIDPWWNPSVERQAIDRAYRMGQQKKVMAVRLICPDTIEDKMRQIQETKKDLVNELIQEEGDFFKSLTKDDLLKLI